EAPWSRGSRSGRSSSPRSASRVHSYQSSSLPSPSYPPTVEDPRALSAGAASSIVGPVTPLALLGALAIGLTLGLLGSGGSILTVPVLVYLVGIPEKAAIAESLAIVCLIAGGGVIPFIFRRLVSW